MATRAVADLRSDDVGWEQFMQFGWAMRRILKCKRKSSPRIDVVEDGGRALVTEEGVSAVVF